jgi:hypothetical protein
MIRLRFVTHPGIFSTLVQYAQGGFKFSHCEAILPDGGDVISAWYDGGTRIRPIGYDAGNFVEERFQTVPCTPEQETAFFSFLKANLGRPYDVLGIAAFALGRDWQCPDKWWCSEYIMAAHVPANMLTPEDAALASKVTVKDLYYYNAALAKAG